MKVLVTGATGFVGRALVESLSESMDVRVAVRMADQVALFPGREVCVVGDIHGKTSWAKALDGVDSVVHCAGIAHQAIKNRALFQQRLHEVNVEGMHALVEASLRAGVKRFVFMSTIKVLGECTTGRPFAANTPPAPTCPYAVSKYQAEQLLKKMTRGEAMETVILRPSLIYGPGVKGNLRALMGWIEKGWPMPLRQIKNARSFVSIQNICACVTKCLTVPEAANQVFLVADEKPLSTPALIEALARARGKTARLFYFPPLFFKLLAKLARWEGGYARLTGSLVVDIAKTKQTLNWEPNPSEWNITN